MTDASLSSVQVADEPVPGAFLSGKTPPVEPFPAFTDPAIPAIEIHNLGFSYGQKVVFRHLSLSIKQSEFVGLIGANGAGKSTLVKLILGLEKPLEGEVRLFGQPREQFKNWSRIGYVSQKAASFNSAFPGTVEEVVLSNLYSSIGLLRRPKAVHRERVNEALQMVGMQDLKKRMIGQLSGGQQQRVFLARVLVNRPQFLFLDEPTVGVDAKSEGEIYQLLHRLNRDHGLGVLLVSHDIGAVTIHAQRLLCMGADGFFQHNTQAPLANDFLSKLYGYSVLAHTHLPTPAEKGTSENPEHCRICCEQDFHPGICCEHAHGKNCVLPAEQACIFEHNHEPKEE